MRSDLNAERVQRLRVSNGLTQADLAASVGVPTATLSRVLSGHLALDEERVLELASTLDCAPQLLSLPPADKLHTKPWLRAYADAPAKTVEQFIADTVLAFEAFDRLRLKLIPERLPIYSGDLNDENGIDEFADTVRDAAEIVSPHVPNMTRAAERLGCVVLPMANELGKHLGMSLYVDGTPVIRVARPGPHVPGDRQRFTVAHELGHLTLHQSCPPPDNADESRAIERQAHRFAGAFLLPADEFLDDLEAQGGRVTLTTLSRMKSRWGVAVKAMVVRLQQLHRVDTDQARSLYKQISARGWNKGEPVEVENETAIWLTKALQRRFDGDPAAESAQATGLSPERFTGWLGWEPPEEATIIEFRARRTRA